MERAPHLAPHCSHRTTDEPSHTPLPHMFKLGSKQRLICGIDRSPSFITRCNVYQSFTFHLIIHSSTSVTSFPLLYFLLLHVQCIQGGRSQRVKTSYRGWDEILVQIAAFHISFCNAAIITCWHNICIAITVLLNSFGSAGSVVYWQPPCYSISQCDCDSHNCRSGY